MKKIILYAFSLLLTVIFVPTVSKANASPVKTEMPADSAMMKTMLENRLEEIQSMDKSSMSRNDKKALKQEENSIHKALQNVNGGIYISVGALIIIILLLIILF